MHPCKTKLISLKKNLTDQKALNFSAFQISLV